MTDIRRLALAGLALAAAGCFAHHGVPDPKPGGLKLTVLQLVTEGTPQVRLLVRNTYDQPIDGVRLVATFYREEVSEPIGSAEQQFDVHLAPGESASLALDVEPRYMSRQGQARFSLRGAPATLGGVAIEPPPGWSK